MSTPQVGDKAPEFQLPDQNGNTVSLAQLAGKNVVLYFYPKDDTPGCTKEACNFRDEHSTLEKAGAVVLGVSPDDTKSHLKFAGKYGLPFTLLADTDHRVAEQYGVWGEKSLYGRKFMGINRATFLIGPDGLVKHSWPKVKVENHVNEVLEVLQGRESDEKPTSDLGETPVTGETSAAVESASTLSAPAAAPRAKRGTRKAAKKAAKKGGAKKAPAKKAAKKGAAKKAAGKKSAAKKGAARKGAAKKGAARKGAAKKAAKKGAAKKGAARKGAAKKAAKKGARKSARR
ncbi:thioredoxin-dependent thiol peroxidase [Myxococcaceae bacterium GXIMD 01537]